MKYCKGIIIIFVLALASCSFKEEVPPRIVEVPEKKSDSELSNELFDAVLKKDYKSVAALINTGTDLEQYDAQGNTVLIRSVQMRDAVLVEMLLKANAMPFVSIKDSPKETAYSKIHKDDTEIQKLFQKSISVMTTAIAKNLTDSKFDVVLSIIKKNNIPFSLPMATQTLIEYPFIFISGPSDRAEDLLKYFIEGRSYESLDVLKNQERLLIASNKMENPEFFSYLIDAVDAARVQKNTIVVVDLAFTDGIKVEDLKVEDSVQNPNWLSKQIEVIASTERVILNFEFLNNLAQNSIKTSIQNDSSGVVAIHSSFLKLNFPASHKNSFTEDVLSVTFSSTGTAKKSMLIKDILTTWRKGSLEKSGYSLDQHSLNTLKVGFAEGLDKKTYTEIVSLFLDYTTDRSSTNTLSEIIVSNLTLSQKTDLVSFTLNYSGKIPKGAFAAAVKNNNVGILSLLTESNIPFDPSEQTDAIEVAVVESKTGPFAQSQLISLKQSGLPFDNSFGAAALTNAVSRIVEQNDTSYVEVVDYLVALSDHPINSFPEEEKITLIHSLLMYSIKNNTTWNTLNKLLLKSNVISTIGQNFNDKLAISDAVGGEIKMSLPWILVLHIFEAKKSSEDAVGTLMPILKQVFRIFQNESFAISVVEKGATINQKLFPTQQMLPLSILLWAGKENIENSLKGKYATTDSLGITLMPISYSNLVVSPVYAYLSTDKEFWQKIIKELLLLENAKLTGINPISIYELMSVVAGANALDEFPSFSKVLDSFQSPIPSSDVQCRFENVTDNEIKDWTTIGSFVALESLLNKSCSGKILSQAESDFFRSFTSNHIENDVSDTFISQSSDSCEPVNMVATVSGTYSVEFSRRGYSMMGTLLLKDKDEDEDSNLITDLLNPNVLYFGKKCKTSPFNKETHQQAKLQFLKDWNVCVLANQDSSMINYLQTLDSKYGFSKMVSTAKVCK